jgi:HAD superfamily hydrolase (TIGR01509 family)
LNEFIELILVYNLPKMNTKQNSPYAIIFDMDGVIVDSNPYHQIALRRFCEKHGYHLSDEYLKTKIFGRTNADWIRELFKDEIDDTQLLLYEEEKESMFCEIFAPHIKPVNGLMDFLSLLREHQVPRAIATSAPSSNVEYVLNKTGVGEFFQIIIDGNMIKHSKPHPEIYLKTIEAIGYPSQKCLVIEDSLSGIESARKAGCIVIGLTTTHTAEELKDAQLVIDDFKQLSLPDLVNLI